MTYKWQFWDIAGHFYTNCMKIFHKTEVPTIILRSLTCLISIGPKATTQNTIFSISILFFLFTQIVQNWKKGKRKILCFASLLLIQLGFRHVKHLKMIVGTSVLWKISCSWQKMTTNARKMAIHIVRFFMDQTLSKTVSGFVVYVLWPLFFE